LSVPGTGNIFIFCFIIVIPGFLLFSAASTPCVDLARQTLPTLGGGGCVGCNSVLQPETSLSGRGRADGRHFERRCSTDFWLPDFF
jgi:hypothetical protein